MAGVFNGSCYVFRKIYRYANQSASPFSICLDIIAPPKLHCLTHTHTCVYVRTHKALLNFIYYPNARINDYLLICFHFGPYFLSLSPLSVFLFIRFYFVYHHLFNFAFRFDWNRVSTNTLCESAFFPFILLEWTHFVNKSQPKQSEACTHARTSSSNSRNSVSILFNMEMIGKIRLRIR